MRFRILVAGNSSVNLLQKIDRLPEAGETLETDGHYAFVPGGNGVLSAVTFARIGADCLICTKLGCDSNAQKLLRMFEKEKIDSRFAVCDKKQLTSFSTTMLDRAQKARTLIYSGASPSITASEIESAFTAYPDALYIQLNLPEDVCVSAVRIANENGTPVFIDAVGAERGFPLGSFGEVEVFSPNEDETEVLCGIRPINADTSLRACIKLSSMINAKYIVLKLGERGSYIYDGIYFHIIPHLAVPVADTIGAGDIYTAALTYCYLQNKDIVEAGRFANYAASLSVSRSGGYDAVPTLEQIKEFSQKINEK